jgi:four helix bundle protein
MQSTKQYDLEERTLEYGKRIIRLAKALHKNTVNFTLIDQVVRSGTSMGANYREANETETKKDRIQPLLQETTELVKIFAAILEKSK